MMPKQADYPADWYEWDLQSRDLWRKYEVGFRAALRDACTEQTRLPV